MSKVFSALAVSVDGYITGRNPGPGRGLGDGATLFDWYADGDIPSREFGGFTLSQASARVFDGIAGRVGASLAGRNTYEDSEGFGGGGPHRRRRCPTARRWSRPGSRTRSRQPAKQPVARTSRSWAAVS